MNMDILYRAGGSSVENSAFKIIPMSNLRLSQAWWVGEPGRLWPTIKKYINNILVNHDESNYSAPINRCIKQIISNEYNIVGGYLRMQDPHLREFLMETFKRYFMNGKWVVLTGARGYGQLVEWETNLSMLAGGRWKINKRGNYSTVGKALQRQLDILYHYQEEDVMNQPVMHRVKRSPAQIEPKYTPSRESWQEYQDRHYRWNYRLPSNVPVHDVPKDEGIVPPHTVKEVLLEVALGFIASGPEIGIGRGGRPGRPGRPTPYERPATLPRGRVSPSEAGPSGLSSAREPSVKASDSSVSKMASSEVAADLHVIGLEKPIDRLVKEYEFPEKSQYYKKEDFFNAFKDKGEPPQWANDFKLLKASSDYQPAGDEYFLENGLIAHRPREGFVYRADSTPPEVVLSRGFRPSEDFTAIDRMIPEGRDAIIVSDSLEGTLRYNTIAKSEYIYKIKNTEGVSLKENLLKNQDNLRNFLGNTTDSPYKTSYQAGEDSQGAVFLDETHVFLDKIKPKDISLVSKEEISSHLPLSEGPWKDYF